MQSKYRPIKTLQDQNGTRVEVAEGPNHTKVILKSMPKNASHRLDHEQAICKIIKQPQLNGCEYVLASYTSADRKYLVLPLLGRNLQQLRIMCGGRFTLKTTLMLAFQMIDRLRYLHSQGILHGDITPQNFLMGTGKTKHKLYLIDFELSKSYLEEDTRQHIKMLKKEQIDGTLRFISVSANRGYPLSRRDQLQSMMYNLVYFIKGELPWNNITASNFPELVEQMAKAKSRPEEQIFEGCPAVFSETLKWIRGLHFDEKPDYEYLYARLHQLFKKHGYEIDYYYDWHFL